MGEFVEIFSSGLGDDCNNGTAFSMPQLRDFQAGGHVQNHGGFRTKLFSGACAPSLQPAITLACVEIVFFSLALSNEGYCCAESRSSLRNGDRPNYETPPA